MWETRLREHTCRNFLKRKKERKQTSGQNIIPFNTFFWGLVVMTDTIRVTDWKLVATATNRNKNNFFVCPFFIVWKNLTKPKIP